MKYSHLTTNNSPSGFTLIELSVTLISIALLMALVSGGSHLLTAARMNSMISQIAGYQKAVDAFRETYQEWPGDMRTATSFFSGTANGNGNYIIENSNGPNSNESLRAWQHLHKAKLLKDNLSGIGEGTGNGAIPKINVPSTALNNGGFSFQGNINGINNLTGNLIIIGAAVTNNATTGSLFNGADSYKIDHKIDDSFPTTGFIRQTNAACINATPTPNEYDASDQDVDCVLYLLLDEK